MKYLVSQELMLHVIGPYDLSGSLKKPGQFEDSEVKMPLRQSFKQEKNTILQQVFIQFHRIHMKRINDNYRDSRFWHLVLMLYCWAMPQSQQ